MKSPTLPWKLTAAVATAVAVAVIAFVLLPRLAIKTKEESIPSLATDEVVVLRTTGGKLQVSTLIKNEEFRWQTSWECPLIDCSEIFAKTVSLVRLPVHYTFAIPLAGEWNLKFRGDYFELRVPNEAANIPPGLELRKLEMETRKGWTSPNTAENQISLMKHLGPELAKRAMNPAYVSAQREQARKTVAEFARKWMLEQGAGKGKAEYPIKVFFEGEVN